MFELDFIGLFAPTEIKTKQWITFLKNCRWGRNSLKAWIECHFKYKTYWQNEENDWKLILAYLPILDLM